MNIRERMASKQLFSDDDANYPKEAAELAKARQRGKALCYEINNLHPDDVEMRNTLMKQLLAVWGKCVDGAATSDVLWLKYDPRE